MVGEVKELMDYGITGAFFLVLLGVGWAGKRLIDAGLTVLTHLTDQINQNEIRAVERHNKMEKHVTDHMRVSSEEHAEIVGEVREALAELRGERRAEEAAAERPTPAAGIPLAAGGRR